MNNQGIKKIIQIVLSIQMAMLGLVGLDYLGFGIPILRQIIGFIYLTFIPGFLILRVLKLHRLGSTERLLYSVGLSIAFVMFIGGFMNTLYPFIGILRPISILLVTFTITFAILILCMIAYKHESHEEKSLFQPRSICWSELFSPPALLLFLLPLIAVLGTHLVYAHQNNILLLILLSLIAIIVILVTFDKFILPRLYPVYIVAIAIAILWHWSLISPSLNGFDIQYEFLVQNQVIINSIWNPAYPYYVNASLSVVMLAPIYSLMLNLDSVWVFKIIYPLFFSLTPLALFQAYKKQTDDKIAFLAAFFFMSFPVFFSDMTAMIRQPTAELFLALSILLFLEKEMQATKRATLVIIFGVSIVVSHPGISYFYMFYLSISLFLLLLWKSNAVNELWQSMIARLSKSRHRVGISRGIALQGNTLTGTYVILFIIFGVSWYIYVSSETTFNAVIIIGDHVYKSLSTELFSLDARDQNILQALGMAPMRSLDVEWHIARIFQYITQLFIVVGVLGMIINLHKIRFHIEYVVMSLVSIVIITISIILPYFATSFNMTRIYHITLLFLAPFCILGGITIFHWLNRKVSMFLNHRKAFTPTNANLKLAVILVLVPYFLFTTGFVFEITSATPTSMPLSLYNADWIFLTAPEIYARTWLGKMAKDIPEVYTDARASSLLKTETNLIIHTSFYENDHANQGLYIFLRRWNIIHGTASINIRTGMAPKEVNLTEITFLNNPNRWNYIYDSGTAKILYS